MIFFACFGDVDGLLGGLLEFDWVVGGCVD
jgi:hypothetical protein